MNNRVCDHCGGTHRLMEICPESPGFTDYLRGWLEGDRGAKNYIAVYGLAILLTLNVVMAVTVFHG